MNETAPQVDEAEAAQARRTRYNRLVRQARLLSIVLDKLDFKADPAALTTDKAALKRALNSNVHLVSYDKESGRCIARIQWNIRMRIKRKIVVKCAASYLIFYSSIKDGTDETVAIFIENVAKVATYSYFRALYAHLDWSAELGSAPLPILRAEPKV